MYRTGRLRAIAVTTAKRASPLPDVQTIAEQGFAGFDEKPWNCFVAPAGTPDDVVQKLREAFATVYRDQELVAALRKAGVEEIGAVPVEQVAAQMDTELAKWGDVIRSAKITLDN